MIRLFRPDGCENFADEPVTFVWIASEEAVTIDSWLAEKPVEGWLFRDPASLVDETGMKGLYDFAVRGKARNEDEFLQMLRQQWELFSLRLDGTSRYLWLHRRPASKPDGQVSGRARV